MIIACPCAVALAIPFTLGNIMRILGKHRFYLKNPHVTEAFSALSDAQQAYERSIEISRRTLAMFDIKNM